MSRWDNVKVWTEEETKFLQENYEKMGPKKCSELLGTTYYRTQSYAQSLGLRMFRSRPWTDEEIEFLKENFPVHLTDYCAKHLGRSWDATHKKANSLGLKPNWKYSYVEASGYIVLCHDRLNKILEHRYVMEQKLGRKLKSTEIVHHIDGNKQNNDPDNLMITNRSDHMVMHHDDILRGKHKR